MRELPSFQTTLVPMGEYIAEVDGEIQEKASAFDASKTFLALPLGLTDAHGEFFEFTWFFNPRSPRYADFLLAIGGRRLASGNIQPPASSYNGRKFVIIIGQRTAKGAKDGRLVNEVLSISPINPAADEPPAEGQLEEKIHF